MQLQCIKSSSSNDVFLRLSFSNSNITIWAPVSTKHQPRNFAVIHRRKKLNKFSATKNTAKKRNLAGRRCSKKRGKKTNISSLKNLEIWKTLPLSPSAEPRAWHRLLAQWHWMGSMAATQNHLGEKHRLEGFVFFGRNHVYIYGWDQHL